MSSDATTLLVVDDNELNLRLLNDVLLTRGYSVTLARSGEEALREARRTPFNLILMDVQMPGMSGTETMQALKRDPAWESAPILAVTALAMQGDEVQLLEAGFDGYISKPIAYKTMLHTVASYLQQFT